jgi:membrane associated rhomboid family serine protease
MSQNEDEWKSSAWAPEHRADDWALMGRRGSSKSFGSSKELLSRLKEWHPMRSTLAASPGSPNFVPPICLAELAPSLRASNRRQFKVWLGIWTLVVCFTLYMAITIRTPISIELFAATFFLVLAVGTDLLLLARHPDALEDRAKFMCWVQRSRRGRRAATLWLSFLFAMGLLQFVLQTYYGGLKPLILAIGGDYQSIRAGELWRCITGPYFHSGAVHFLNNAFLLVLIGTVSWSMLGWESLAAFLLGNIAGLVAQLVFGSQSFNAFLGISPGVFALFGCVLASSLVERDRWPRGFPSLCAWLALASAILAQILAKNSGTVSHFTGFLVGFALALIFHFVLRAGRSAGLAATRNQANPPTAT